MVATGPSAADHTSCRHTSRHCSLPEYEFRASPVHFNLHGYSSYCRGIPAPKGMYTK